MSRVGNRLISIPNGVKVAVDGSTVEVTGNKGSLKNTFSDEMSINLDGDTLRVTRPSDDKRHKSLHGLTGALLANMVKGVNEGFRKSLDLIGAGYRAQESGQSLVLQLGYSHQIEIVPLPGVTLSVEGANRIHVDGIDKQAVGEMAARIRRTRKPNAYTGKGVHLSNEVVRLKPGKAAGRTS